MMTSLFSFNKAKTSVALDVDIHSHLIPSIDDGAKNIQESIILLKSLVKLGYKKVITTPHIMVDTYCNTRETIECGLKKLRDAAREENIEITIEAAAEYYLDDGFLSHVHRNDVLSFGDSYLLFETSYIAKPLQFDEMISEIIAAGFKPVIAHPERYRYIQDMAAEYKVLKDKNIYFQVNINSFGGHYGKDAKRKAEYLSKRGMIDFLGSDVHYIKQLETLSIIQKKKIYQEIFRKNNILNDAL